MAFNGLDVAVSTIYVINIIQSLIFLLLTIVKTSCDESVKRRPTNKLSNAIRFITIGHILFYFIHFVTSFPFTVTSDALFKYILVVTNKFCIITAECLFYILLLFRLQSTFNLTVYHVPNMVVFLYGTSIGILFILWVLYEFIFSNYHQIEGYLCFGLVIHNVMLSTFLIYSFNSRLFNLTTIHRGSLSPSIAVGNDMYNNENAYEVELNPRKNKLVDTIVKTSLLNTISIIFFQILLIFWGLYELDIIAIEEIYKTYIMSLSILIEVCCVYLIFSFNNKLYKKICGSCHQISHHLCSKMANYKLETNKPHKVTESASNYQFLL